MLHTSPNHRRLPLSLEKENEAALKNGLKIQRKQRMSKEEQHNKAAETLGEQEEYRGKSVSDQLDIDGSVRRKDLRGILLS